MLMFYGAPKFHDQFWAGHPSSQEETKVFVKYALDFRGFDARLGNLASLAMTNDNWSDLNYSIKISKSLYLCRPIASLAVSSYLKSVASKKKLLLQSQKDIQSSFSLE